MSPNDAEREPVEALAAEFMERQRRGEGPSIDDYARRYPELADEIRDLFPTILALEGWKSDRAAPPTLLAPNGGKLTYLGDYRIIREIGRGGMGIVYEAMQESLGRHVAVKVLQQGPSLGDKQLRRFEREAKTAARLHHTNIVPVFGVGEQDGLRYYVMQFIRGVGLDAVLDALRGGAGGQTASWSGGSDFSPWTAADALRSGSFPELAKNSAVEKAASATERLQISASQPAAGTVCFRDQPDSANGEARQEETSPSPAEVLPHPRLPRAVAATTKAYWKSVARLGRQVANALDYAHAQHVLHRDIKPANLLLDATGIVWVADFGLAKVLEQDNVSQTGDLVGTLRYMAPEQFQGKQDSRSDIYSLGLTLYELLTLRPAFDDSDRARLIHKITQHEPPRPRQINPAIPRDLETIVLKASAREPGRRYQSAKELHDDLERYLEDRPIQARRIGYVERLGRWCRRNPAVAGLIVLAGSLLVLVAVVATIGYVRTQTALKGETQQRERAEATSRLSLEVLEQIFEQLAPERIVAAGQLTLAAAGDEEVELALQPTLSRESAALLEQLLVFYDRLAEQGNDDSKVRRQAAKANRRVGDIRSHLGQSDQALQAYQRAASLYAELATQRPDDAELSAELAGAYNALGRARRKAGQPPDKAREAHLLAVEVLGPAAAVAAPPATVRYELARSHFHLGRLGLEAPPLPPPKKESPASAKKRGPPPPSVWERARAEAEQHLAAAADLLHALVKEQPAVPAYRHLLALCYREKSTRAFAIFLRINPNDRKEKLAFPKLDANDRKQCIELLEQLVKQFPNVPEYRFDLSETLAQMDVRGLFVPGSAAPSARDFDEALRLAKELVAEHPNVPDYQVSKAQIHSKRSLVHRHARRPQEAEKQLRLALELQTGLVQRFPNVSFHHFSKARIQESLADVLSEQKKWDASRPLLEESIGQLKKLIGQDDKMGFLSFALAENYAKLARVLRELNEPELATQAEQQAAALRPFRGPPKGPAKGPPKGK